MTRPAEPGLVSDSPLSHGGIEAVMRDNAGGSSHTIDRVGADLIICIAMTDRRAHDLLHGVSLEQIVTSLVEHLGWSGLGERIKIRCFTTNPSIKSSLKFLRKTPWARTKVEELYIATQKKILRKNSRKK